MGNKIAKNRIALNAMDCNDADMDGDPSELTYKRYMKAFHGNAGVIVMEAISVIDGSGGGQTSLLELGISLYTVFTT